MAAAEGEMMVFYQIICGIIGLIALLCAIPGVIVAIRKRKWIEAEAVILKTDAKRSRDRHNQPVIEYRIDYAFNVAGTRYVGSDTVLLEPRADYEAERSLEELRKDYAEGSLLKIYYDSLIPQLSSARVGNGELFKVIFAGTVFLFAAVVLHYLDLAMDMSARR